MILNKKGRAGCHQAAQKPADNGNSTAIASRIKATVVTLALWGILPIRLADWIINQGGLHDA